MTQGIRWSIGFLALAASGTVSAHVGVHPDGVFATGLAHPFIGLDHLLAMVAVGVWAVQLGERQLLIVPATFVLSMVAGALLGKYGVALPQVESMVALSVLALGVLVALAMRARWYWAAPVVAVFALFHGHAHGTEMPEFSGPWLYFAGFTLATAALHALGVAGGVALKTRPAILRAGGAAIGLTGAWLLLGA